MLSAQGKSTSSLRNGVTIATDSPAKFSARVGIRQRYVQGLNLEQQLHFAHCFAQANKNRPRNNGVADIQFVHAVRFRQSVLRSDNLARAPHGVLGPHCEYRLPASIRVANSAACAGARFGIGITAGVQLHRLNAEGFGQIELLEVGI